MPDGKPLAAMARMKEMMIRHFRSGWTAREEGKRVAYATSGAPVEFLLGAGLVPVYPENHGAVCGVARAGGALCREAEGKGVPRDLCSYWRIDGGSRSRPEASPVGGLPPPDLLLCANNICRTVVRWFEGLSRRYRVPLLMMDLPFRHGRETRAARDYVRRQFRDLPDALSRIPGVRFRRDRFEEAAVLSREASQRWSRCLRANRHRPSPTTAIEQFLLMGPVVTMRGTRETVDFYGALEDEISERVRQGRGAIPDERIRLLWDNLPVWHRLRMLAAVLEARGAVLVGATYTNAWTRLAEEGTDPVDGLADAYAGIWLNSGLGDREEILRGMAKELSADGVLYHVNRSCKPYSFGQQEIAARLAREGIPGLLLEADMADERDFSEGAWRTRIEAFLETLSGRYGGGG